LAEKALCDLLSKSNPAVSVVVGTIPETVVSEGPDLKERAVDQLLAGKYGSVKNSIKAVHLFEGLLIAAVLINIVQFRAIDEQADHRYQAINRYDTADIMAIGYRTSANFRQRYSFVMALAEKAPGSRVVLPFSWPHGTEEMRMQMLTLGKASEVIQRTYDVDTLLTQYNLAAFFIAMGDESMRNTPWAISAGSSSPREFVIVRWEQPVGGQIDVLVDTSLIPDHILKELAL